MIERARGRRPADGLLTAAAWAAAAGLVAAFAWMAAGLLRLGVGELSLGLVLDAPRDAGRAGGIAPILVSTGLIVLVCLAAALPLGLGTAIALAELTPTGGRFARVVRGSLDVLAGVPSIVFGLFGSAFFCHALGLGYSILSGGLTLACMVLPLLVRTLEQGLRAVPQEQRLAAAALGLPRPRVVLRVVLPAAAPALAVGLVLGIGRALSETAALIFTSGYVDRMPASLYDSGRALSVHILDLALNVPGGAPRAAAAALLLGIILLAVNNAAAALAARWQARSARL